MNPRALKVALLLLLALVCVQLDAQTEQLGVIKNQPATYTFLSRVQPVIGRSPNQGSAVIEADAAIPFSYILTYTPDRDYVGSDNFMLVSFPFGSNVAFVNFDVQVREAEIVARHDYAVTSAGQAIRIPVLDNDTVNVGGMQLTLAPAVNGGTARVEGNDIVFTPASGTVGLADLNYVVCSDFGACDLGTVSITVNGAAANNDTLRVFTRRDEPQFIFAPADAEPRSTPANGQMVDLNGVMGYQPDPGFVGDEWLTYADAAGNTTTYQVTVLDLQRDLFSVEDRASTPIDQPATINVLRNDLYSVFTDCVEYGVPAYGSLAVGARYGEVVYTPPPGWSGVDEFTYTSMAPGCEGMAETQTVYVFVDDFAPAAGEATITTPAGTPVDLTYQVAGGQVRWSVTTPPAYGTAHVDPANGTIVYTPLATAAGRSDNLTLEYCLVDAGTDNCQLTRSIPVTVNVTALQADACSDEDCVWPGDTNRDGVVDVDDLLPIGLAMGSSGTPRLSAAADGWSAQYSEDWGQEVDGIDLKHVDADGDRFISAADTQVVMQNLGLGHRLRPEPIEFTTFDLSLIGPLDAEPGDLVRLDIVAGNNVVIVEDVFGFRFQFQYDPSMIEADAVGVDYDEEGWAAYDSPILSLTQNYPAQGRLSTAFTRTSRDGISGYGSLGTMNVVIVEDVFGFRDEYRADGIDVPAIHTVIDGGSEGATVTTAAGHTNAVRVNPFTLTIKPRPATDLSEVPATEATAFLEDKLLAFPNPTGDRLTVHLNGQQTFSALQLTDMTGRVVVNRQGLDTNHDEISVARLPIGVYSLTLTTTDGVVHRKIEVAR